MTRRFAKVCFEPEADADKPLHLICISVNGLLQTILAQFSRLKSPVQHFESPKKMNRGKDSVALHRILGIAALLFAVLPAYVVASLVRGIIYDLSHGHGFSSSGSAGEIIFNLVLFGGSAFGLGLLGAAAIRSFRASASTLFRPSFILLILGIGTCLLAWFLSGVLFFVVGR